MSDKPDYKTQAEALVRLTRAASDGAAAYMIECALQVAREEGISYTLQQGIRAQLEEERAE